MLYFIIVPLFLLALVLMTGATLASWFIAPLRPAYPFCWRILLWSSLGFLLANSLVFALFLLVPGGLVWPEAEQPIAAVKYGYAVILLLGPVIASIVGFLGGSMLGLRFAFNAKRRGLLMDDTP